MKISEVVAKRFVAHGFAYHREEVAAITITGEVESDAATLVQQAPQPFVQQLMVVDPVQSGIGEGNIKTFAQPQFSDINNDEAQVRTQVCNRSVDHAARGITAHDRPQRKQFGDTCSQCAVAATE